MQEPIYRQALHKSLQLVLNHKTLWIFGVLSLLLGQLGWNNFIGGLNVFGGESFIGSYLMNFPWSALFNKNSFFMSSWLIFIFLALLSLVLLLSVASEGALIAAGTAWFKGGKMLKMDLAWQKGVKHFKRLFILNIFKKALLLLLLVSVNSLTAGLINSTSSADGILLIAFITAGIFFALIIVSVSIYASGYIVEGELPLVVSLQKGVALFLEHVLVTLELSLILLGIQVLIVLCLAYASVWFLLPFVTFSIVAGLTGSTGLIMTGLLSSAVVFLIISAIIGGVLNAFAVSAWMYLFMKMHHEGVGSRIMHLFSYRKA